MYTLDTDHLGILQRATGPEYVALSRRIAQYSQTDFYVSQRRKDDNGPRTNDVPTF